MTAEKVAVHISRSLYEKVRERVNESGGEFKTVEEYVEFVLNEVVSDKDEGEVAYTPEEEEEIKRRLKSLGYL